MSLWTLSVLDSKNLLNDATKTLIDANVRYTIDYLDRYIDWNGILDFKVFVKSYEDLKNELGWDINGIIPATEMSWIPDGGRLKKSNLIEALTGIDRNGDAADAGFTIYLGKDGTLLNYGVPVWIDPNPVFNQATIPSGSHDFISIALHEILHTLAFDQADFADSTLGGRVTFKDGVYYFGGDATVKLLGAPLAFDSVGHIISALTPQYKISGMVSDVGNYEQNRWDIGRIELAVMKDLGFDVNGSMDGLSYTDLDDKKPDITGADADEVIYGDFHNNNIRSGAGNDTIEAGAGNDYVDGGTGTDTAVYVGRHRDYTVTKSTAGLTVHDGAGVEGTDALVNVERIRFSDVSLAFDIDGTAGKAYRIYQAAFDRQPDISGLGYWIAQMDKGASLKDMAGGFLNSDEFATLYGDKPTAELFLTKLYNNVLHRAPDQGGYDYWLNAISANDSASFRVDVLESFSESGENVAQVADIIANGFAYTWFTG